MDYFINYCCCLDEDIPSPAADSEFHGRRPAKRKPGYGSSSVLVLVMVGSFLLGQADAAVPRNVSSAVSTPTMHRRTRMMLTTTAQMPGLISSSRSSTSSMKSLMTTTSGSVMVMDNTTMTDSREIQCLPLRHTFGVGSTAKMGLDSSAQMPRRPINGDHLKICSKETTCCTKDMEEKLNVLASQDYARLLNEHLNRFKSLLISRTTKFDDYFTELIRNARHNLNTMFIRTYGPLYEKNAIIFTELFDKLEIYYRGNRGHVNLHSAINTFFSDLFKKMFALLNAQYTLDNTQLQCVSRHMDKVKPFGDVAEKLSQHVRRAFVEARTFVQALAIGRDTARTASEMPITQQCSHALTRMMYCPQCRGMMDLKPCTPYCLSVTKSCLGQHIEMESEWNQYIDALLMLAERLRSPFNIETVITPIDVKISEAIMNLQEQGQNISNKIFLECGKPRLSKRAAPASRRNHNVSSAAAGGDLAATNHGGPVNLEQLSRDIKEKLIQSKDFWSALPAHLCSDYGKTFKTPLQEDCWNGLTKSKTASSALEDAASGGGAPARLPKSAESDSPKPTASTAIVQQMHQLKLVTLKLKQAYNGMDVEWIETVSDDEDDTEEHSRTGSSPSHGHASDSSELGSGSGDRDPEITDEDEDSAIIEGSGTPPPVPANPVTVIHIVHVTTTVAPPPAHHRGAKLHVISTPAPDFEFDSTTISTTTPQPPSVPPVSVTTTIPIPTTTTAQTVSLLPPKPTVRSSASVSVLPVSGICWTILFATLVWIGR